MHDLILLVIAKVDLLLSNAFCTLQISLPTILLIIGWNIALIIKETGNPVFPTTLLNLSNDFFHLNSSWTKM